MAREVTMSVRVSDAEAAEIDAARGPADRGTWLRDVALAAARKPARAPRAVPGAAERPATSPVADRGPRRDPKTCKHANMRLHRGWCPDCESMAVKK